SKAAVQTEFTRLRHVIILRLVLQNEQPGLACLLVIGRISFRTAANRGHADAVSVTEVNFESGDALAILHLHQRHPVLTPDLLEGTAFGEQRRQPVAIHCHRFRADGVQRYQHMIASLPKATHPVLWSTYSVIAHQFRTFCGSSYEGTV